MSQLTNGVEVLLHSNNAKDYIPLPAVLADVVEQDAFVYWDTSANKVKKFAPSDSTTNATNQGVIIGIASAGKKNGDDKLLVCFVADVLMTVTGTPALGKPAVITYSPTTGKYAVHEGAAYNTAVDPDITLTKDFAILGDEAAEADTRIRVKLDGKARFAALT